MPTTIPAGQDIFDFQPHFIGDKTDPKSFEPSFREVLRYYYKQLGGPPGVEEPCIEQYIEQFRRKLKDEMFAFALDAIHDSSIQKELFDHKFPE